MENQWAETLALVKRGDVILFQWGHNDDGPLDDTARARGTIHGTGNESREIENPILKIHESVHTYGWYLRKYVTETQARGAIPIICSPIPRKTWKDGKVVRNAASYGGTCLSLNRSTCCAISTVSRFWITHRSAMSLSPHLLYKTCWTRRFVN